MFKPDEPIKTKKEDILERDSFVNELSESIMGWDSENSMIISLNGKWGSGKTSILNLVKEQIQKTEDIVTFDFNPWFFANKDLTKHFFNEVAKELYNKKEPKLAKGLKKLSLALDFKAFDDFFDKLIQRGIYILALLGLTITQFVSDTQYSQIKNFIGVVFLVLLCMELIKLFSSQISTWITTFRKKETVKDLKEKISEQIITGDKRLVVFIDDIDRLEALEVKEIIKLVKVNSDFPRTIFVLAYDEKVVVEALNKGSWFDSQNYLEKIIQVSFDIPKPNQTKILDHLTKSVDEIIEELDISRNFQQEYWTNTFNDGLKGLFENIRDVKRFINTFRFNFNVFNENGVLNINITDLIGLEAIRLKHPKFYMFIRDNKNLFTSTDGHYSRTNVQEKEKTEIKEALKKYRVTHLEKLVSRMFPQVGGLLGNTSYGSEWQKTWAKDLRVCSQGYFDQYFRLIPGGGSDNVSQYEIFAIFALSDDKEKLNKYLGEYKAKDRLDKLLYRFENHIEDEQLADHAKQDNLIECLFDLASEEEKSIPLSFGPNLVDSTFRIAYNLLKKDKGEESRLNRLEKVIDNVESWDTVLHFVYLMESKKDPSNNLFDDKDTQALRKKVLGKVEKVPEKEFVKNPLFIYTLYRLKEESRTSKLESIITYYSENKNYIEFLRAFKTTSTSTTVGDHYSKEKHQINVEALKDFIPIKTLEKLVKDTDFEKKDPDLFGLFEESLQKYKSKKKEESKDKKVDRKEAS